MRIRLLSLGITLVSVAVAHAAYAGPSREAAVVREARPVVIELFTSQGCSDCPAADALLTELSKRRDVIALSLPITYWDMLGWKDTFATEGNTQRQKAYARALNRSGIYTPQMIVDGTLDVVGNEDRSAVQLRQTRPRGRHRRHPAEQGAWPRDRSRRAADSQGRPRRRAALSLKHIG